MSRRALVLDGLWYCLCPSFSFSACSRPVSFSAARRRSTRPCVPRFLTSPRRCYSSNFPGIGGGHNIQKHTAQTYGHDAHALDPPSQSSPNGRPSERQHVGAPPEPGTGDSAPQRRPPRVPTNLDGKTASELETMLQHLAANSPNIRHVTQVLRALIRDRHVKPGPRHYKALILANTDSERGSPDAVRDLLAEMEHNGIAADSGTLHAALQVLAVHPDYLLRQEVLRKLRDRWLALSPAGWQFVVAGLLREHQFELALEQVSLMERKEIPVENWLHSLIIYNLCDFKEFDEVHHLMQVRVKQNHSMTPQLWLHVLNAASENLHFEMTRYVWQRMVELGHLHPPYKLCSNVLTLASRHGDPELGNSVFQYLTETGVPLCLEDYERLVEANVKAGDLSAAFEVLCAVHDAGIAVEEASTHAIREYMIQNKFDHREAWQILKRLQDARGAIPISCVRPIADLCDHLAAHDSSVVDDGVGFYKELYTLCPGGADVAVFNALIRMCRRARNREAGMFLVKEMASLGVVPNGETFESIMLMCLDAGNFRSAYMYFQDLVKREGALSKEAQTEISTICADSVNEYALRLQYHPRLRSAVQEEAAEQQQQREATSPPRHILPPAVRRQRMTVEERREWNKQRRKEKRRRLAIARNMEEEGWMDWEAGGVDGGSAKSGE